MREANQNPNHLKVPNSALKRWRTSFSITGKSLRAASLAKPTNGATAPSPGPAAPPRPVGLIITRHLHTWRPRVGCRESMVGKGNIISTTCNTCWSAALYACGPYGRAGRSASHQSPAPKKPAPTSKRHRMLSRLRKDRHKPRVHPRDRRTNQK